MTQNGQRKTTFPPPVKIIQSSAEAPQASSYSTTVCSHSEIANIVRKSDSRSSEAVQKR